MYVYTEQSKKNLKKKTANPSTKQCQKWNNVHKISGNSGFISFIDQELSTYQYAAEKNQQ